MASILFPLLRFSENLRPFVLEGIATDFEMSNMARSEGQSSAFWVQTRKGSGQVILGDEPIEVAHGQAVWINPGQGFAFKANAEGWEVDFLMVSGSGLDCLIHAHEEFGKATVFYLPDDSVLHEHFTAILEKGQDFSLSDSDRQSMEAYSCILEISRQVSTRPLTTRGMREQRLQPVLDFIASHFRDSITLDALANVMGVTPQHLCTVFRKMMGQRIFEYINQIRVQASKSDLIANPDKSVKAVANDCGFDDVSYFCSIFKRFEKITPGDFRKLFHN